MRVTYRLSNTAGIGLISRRKSASGSTSRCSRTPALQAAVRASSEIGSQAPKTRSSSSASGTSSLMSGARFSVRLPSRIVAIWVKEPIGLESPRRILSTPAMNVVATAPRPGVRMPSFPVAGRIVERAPDAAFFEPLDEACTYSISFQQRTRYTPTTAQPTGLLAVWESKRIRLHTRCGLVIDKCNALDHGDPGGHSEEDDDERQHPPIQREAKERLWDR